MSIFEFTLKFGLADVSVGLDEYVEMLGAGGCDDAIIGVGQSGRIALNFAREAESAFDAIASAITDVKNTIPSAYLLEAAPDLVGLSDVAALLGYSRQYMRKLMLANGAHFPAPIHEGKSALWRLASVLVWLSQSKNMDISEALLSVAETNRQFNMAREVNEVDPAMQKHIHSLVS